MKRKILSFILVLTMLTGIFPAVVSSTAGDIVTFTSAEYVNSAEIYSDVKENAWYKTAVDYVSTYGIMEGAGSADTFKPDSPSSRAMIAVILHRIEGEPKAAEDAPFKDNKASWYRNAVNWAYESGVVKGRSNTEFDPDGNVTRQELVEMIFNYVKYKNLDSTGVGNLEEFSDHGLVAKWATDSVSWALHVGIITGRSQSGTLSLAPIAESQRSELAKIFHNFCEKYDLMKKPEDTETPTPPETPEPVEPVEPMTIEEVLADTQSDRKKKVILDCDAGNEIDDQYAIAYALGSDKLEVLSINASQFLNTALVPTRKDGMLEGYNEIKRVLKLVGREDIPVYRGCEDSVTKEDHYGEKYPQVDPIESEAVDNIINTAKSSSEIIYVIVTGCATNISCAIAKDPSIMDNICVVWMGSNHTDYSGGAGEFNLGQDNTAGRYLLNSGVNLIWVPAKSDDSTEGSQVLKEGRAFLESSFPGTDAASSYFRRDLPLEHDGGYNERPDTWWHIYWDAAGVAVFDAPEYCTFKVVDLPRLRADDTFSIEEGRPKAIMLEKLTPAPVLNNMVNSINSLIGD